MATPESSTVALGPIRPHHFRVLAERSTGPLLPALLLALAIGVFVLDLSQGSPYVGLGYLAVTLLSAGRRAPAWPLYTSIASVALIHVAALVAAPAEAEMAPALGRGLVSLAVLATGAICHFRLRSNLALGSAIEQIRILTGLARNIEVPVTILDTENRVVFWNE